MKFSIIILSAAKQDREDILDYLSQRSPQGSSAWAEAFYRALLYLQDFSLACPLAAENDHVDFEVREVRFKTRRGRPYRALFTIRGDQVIILHIRGPGQDSIPSEDVRGPTD